MAETVAGEMNTCTCAAGCAAKDEGGVYQYGDWCLCWCHEPPKEVLVRVTSPSSGLPFDVEQVKMLDWGKVYHVDQIAVGDFTTRIELCEVPGVWFNSVHFSTVFRPTMEAMIQVVRKNHGGYWKAATITVMGEMLTPMDLAEHILGGPVYRLSHAIGTTYADGGSDTVETFEATGADRFCRVERYASGSVEFVGYETTEDGFGVGPAVYRYRGICVRNPYTGQVVPVTVLPSLVFLPNTERTLTTIMFVTEDVSKCRKVECSWEEALEIFQKRSMTGTAVQTYMAA